MYLSVIDSNLILFWSEKMHYLILILLNILRFVLWPRMWSFLVNALCSLENNAFSVLVVNNVL